MFVHRQLERLQAARSRTAIANLVRQLAVVMWQELYQECKLSRDYEILDFAHDYVGWLKKEGFADVAQTVNRKLVQKIREGFTVAQLAVFTWTLTDQVHHRELCSYMNEIVPSLVATNLKKSVTPRTHRWPRAIAQYQVREDHRERLKPLIPLVRAMNSFIVTRGKAAAEWPPENVTYRGAGAAKMQRPACCIGVF